MEKTIVIDGKEIKFKSTGATPLRYKAQFRKDYLGEIIKLSSLEKLNSENLELEDYEDIDFEVMYNVAWVLAKTANANIPDPISWLDGFETFPLMDIMPDLTEMITSSIRTSSSRG